MNPKYVFNHDNEKSVRSKKCVASLPYLLKKKIYLILSSVYTGVVAVSES